MSSTKFGMTTVTTEGLFAIVNQIVSFQLVRVGEPWVADVAGVGPLTGVNAQVTTQIGNLNELTIAVTARVGLFAGVQAHVGFQVVVSSEPLVALRTLKRLLTRMSSFVILQHVLVAKRSIADLACKDLLSTGIFGSAGNSWNLNWAGWVGRRAGSGWWNQPSHHIHRYVRRRWEQIFLDWDRIGFFLGKWFSFHRFLGGQHVRGRGRNYVVVVHLLVASRRKWRLWRWTTTRRWSPWTKQCWMVREQSSSQCCSNLHRQWHKSSRIAQQLRCQHPHWMQARK